MKRSIFALIFAALMLLSSCGGNDTKKNDETEKPEETDTVSESASEETDAPEEETDTEAADDSFAVPFDTVSVIGCGYAKKNSADSVLAIEAECFYSSKPSVATVDADGTIRAGDAGVTLIAYETEGQWQAVALCVVEDLNELDRGSSYSAETFEVGSTFMHTAPVGGVEYSSSNESVVDVSAAPMLSFKESGYACVTCNSASRPFTYSFVVYDRVVEE